MVICASVGCEEADNMAGPKLTAKIHHRQKAPAIAQRYLCKLLLEEILEGLAGIIVPRRGRRSSRNSLLRVGRGRSVFLHRGAKFVECAVVLRVLGRDALGNGLGAFKLRAAVEEPTLFAAVQLERAF